MSQAISMQRPQALTDEQQAHIAYLRADAAQHRAWAAWNRLRQPPTNSVLAERRAYAITWSEEIAEAQERAADSMQTTGGRRRKGLTP